MAELKTKINNASATAYINAAVCISISFFIFAPAIAVAGTCDYPGTKGKVEEYYTGPLIDTHLHIPSPLDANDGNPVLRKDMTMADIACTLQYEGTRSAFAFFPVYAGDASYEKFYKGADTAKANYSDVFVRFINPPGKQSNVPTVTVNKLKGFLRDRPNVFQGYGEIGLYGDPTAYKPNAYIFKNIYQVVRKRKLLVYYHPGENQLNAFRKTLTQYPDINFVVHGEQIENDVADLMNDYDNIYFTVNDLYGDQYLLHRDENEESFLEKIDDYETLIQQDLATWQERIEAHPRQFLWGTDRGGIAAWTLDKDVGLGISDYGRAFIARLDPEVQELFAYKNAQRLINSTK